MCVRMLCITLLGLLSVSVHANWLSVAQDTNEIVVKTVDMDGKVRATKMWIAVVDETAFIRTSGTPTEKNILRMQSFVIDFDGFEVVIVAERVFDRALVHRVQHSFRAKYGRFPDTLARLVRIVLGGGSNLYRLRKFSEVSLRE